MSEHLRQFRKFPQKPLAAFLIVWLSGFVFLFCCEMSTAAATQDEFCPLAKVQNHCDKSTEESRYLSASDLPHSNAAECCGFLPVVFDKKRKVEKVHQVAPATRRLKAELAQTIAFNKSAEPASYRSFRVVQRKIFAKNCIFRI